MDTKTLIQKAEQVRAEYNQVAKALNALTTRHDELVGQQALLEQLLIMEQPVVTKKPESK